MLRPIRIKFSLREGQHGPGDPPGRPYPGLRSGEENATRVEAGQVVRDGPLPGGCQPRTSAASPPQL